MALQDKLKDWTDWDVASFFLGKQLGFFTKKTTFQEVKYLFWTDNKVGSYLIKVLNDLVSFNILIMRNEPDLQYKTKISF